MADMKPITPAEVADKKQQKLPDEVINAFNTLIEKDFDGWQSVVYQDDAVSLIQSLSDVKRSDIFEKGWLNVEELFRKSGWEVDYKNTAYNDSSRAYFTFRVKKIIS